jgi:N-acetylglutamate synthase-like GNAT family acetyltransferase
MKITIRPARAEDQETILSYIRQAKLNPRNLQWEHFLIAEEDGKPLGIRQVKIHKKGTREVASGFVLPAYRRQGVSAHLMKEILSREPGPLYLMCRDRRAPYYEQFGFRHVAVNQLPDDFLSEYRIGRLITTLLSLFSKDKIRIIPMKRG